MQNSHRMDLSNKKRIVIKIGSTSLTHPETGAVNLGKIEQLARQISDLKGRGKEVVLVTSGAVAAGKLPELAAAEIDCAKACGLEKIIADSLPAPASASAEDVKAPPAEPTNEEIHGVDVLAIEDAVRELWKHNIYAESSMGCTGPVVKLNKAKEEEARKILGAAGYL